MAFGAPSTGFSFGAPSSSPSPFGAASTPAFGATPTPSLFGASPTPAFGSSSPSPFGSAPSPFGTPTSTPAFGAAASTPSLFGASGAPAASTGGFSFSAPSSSAAGQAGGSTFGSVFAPATTSTMPGAGVFGQPAAGANIFGALTTQQPQQQAQQQPGTQLSPLAYSSSEHENVKRELEALASAYMPQHTSFKFQHLFLNVVDNPAQRVKPPQVVDELCWKQALRDAGGPDNPDRLWPVPAAGFDDLLKRGQAQEQALAENKQRLEQLRDMAHKLAQRQATEVAARVAAARARHVELCERLLAVARHVDGLEGRLANYMGIRGELSRGKEAALSRQLELVEAQLSHTSPAGLQRRLDALAAACRLRASSGAGLGAAEGGGVHLDEASLQQLFSVLKEHVAGVKQLQEVLRRDVLDVEIMRGSRHDISVPAAVNIAAVEYV